MQTHYTRVIFYILTLYRLVKCNATVLYREHTLKVTIFASGSRAENANRDNSAISVIPWPIQPGAIHELK